jgi:hypothetical protein
MRNGVVTHTYILEAPVELDDFTLECEPVDIERFDALDLSIPTNSLIKIDTDGHDIQAALGFGRILSTASVIIIEATFSKLAETLSVVSAEGFDLIDIVDIIYYGESVYQCDLVFARSSLVNNKLRPNFTNFQIDLWNSY